MFSQVFNIKMLNINYIFKKYYQCATSGSFNVLERYAVAEKAWRGINL